MSNLETIPYNYGNANNNTHKRRAKTASFSSILLDSIYRSIDDTDGGTGTATAAATPTSDYNNDTSDHNYDYDYNYSGKSKQRRGKIGSDSSTLETLNLGHAIMIDSWMDRQQSQPYDYDDQKNIRTVRHKSVQSKATTILSSDTSNQNLLKIHTNCFAPTTKRRETTSSRIFTKTKLKAKKIYGDLKKNPPKSPISPGAKIAAFLNSIFRNSGDRKPNNHPPPTPEPSTSTSCMSKATSSRGKSSNTSRSVRFYVADEGDRHQSVRGHEDSSPEYHQKGEKEIDVLMAMIKRNCREIEEEEVVSLNFADINGGGDDDGESCGSSDLFELECIGVSRYDEELPVYGTTSLYMING